MADRAAHSWRYEGQPDAGRTERPGRRGSGRAHMQLGRLWQQAVVFTHDAVVRAAVAWALGTGPEVYRHLEVANCSITTVRVLDGVRRLVRANDVGHLNGAGPRGLLTARAQTFDQAFTHLREAPTAVFRGSGVPGGIEPRSSPRLTSRRESGRAGRFVTEPSS